MAYNATANSVQPTRRHGAHDSALDVEAKDDLRLRVRELEDDNHSLAERAIAACTSHPCSCIPSCGPKIILHYTVLMLYATAQRFADYENEIRDLQTLLREQQDRHHAQPTPEPDTPTSLPDKPAFSRLGSFMRKPSLAITTSTSQGHSAREQELEAALVKEQTARIEAEKKMKQVNLEVEDLSATLFQQANDMVATERKENAALKERIQVLESPRLDPVGAGGSSEVEKLRQKIKVLEQRDMERQKRLEKLEAAQKRIDRVRTLLLPR